MSGDEPINVIIAGGGTGGHLYPGIALAQEFERRWPGKTQVMFIGTAYGIENKVLPNMHYAFKKIWMRGLQRNLSLSNLLFPLRLLISFVQCAATIRKFRPNVIIGTGGYVSGPALLAAIALGIPTVIQEQNSYPGLVNRLLGKWVSQVHVTYEASLPYFKNQPNVFVSGNPVRGEFNQIDRKTAAAKFNLDPTKTTLFVFGGSQGARAINQRVVNSIARLLSLKGLQILWATGPADFEMVKAKCKNYTERLALHPYIDDLAAAYAASDFALCRAGATTLAELTICGLPAILVPYPYAAAGHQDFNAQTLANEGAALVIFEKSFTEEMLIQAVTDLLNNKEKRAAMSQAARKLARPHAARDIVDKIANLMET
jgi:UDP-N-acetylglucosamine--N-acetylmuramyl-(pentapeptide) pyrophosphoryl-undecaprenol N-acetylglucosamine transferase